MPSTTSSFTLYRRLYGFCAALLLVVLTSQFCAAEQDFIDINLGSSAADTSQALIAPPTPPPAPTLSAAEAAEKVRRAFGGEVMSVNTQTNNLGTIYAVKMLKVGRMKTIQVDGQSGQLLNH